MKKTIIIVAAIIILGGGGFYFLNQQQADPSAPDLLEKSGGLVVKDSLFSWLKKGVGVECAINAEEGDIKLFAAGNKVRMDGVAMMAGNKNAEPGVFLTDGDFVYIWSGTEGIKMDMKKMQELAGEEEAQNVNQYSWENMAQEWDAAQVNYDCKEKRLADSVFNVPEEVAFVDWTEMMSGVMEMGEKIQASTGEGEDANPEDMEKMMEDMNMEDMRAMMEDMELPAE
ncbi:MAG: hypothetical protein U9R06_01490 [Patescibacteria group bacterium]|nr:hypothetical protein [Patescibacteria group bacterium]